MAYAARNSPGGPSLRAGVSMSLADQIRLRGKLLPNRLLATQYVADGALSTVGGDCAVLTKGSAGAYTVAAPVSGVDDGTILVMTAGTNFAHVVTFTGNTLLDGTTGANAAWTSAAFIGSSLTVMAMTGKWLVIAQNLGACA